MKTVVFLVTVIALSSCTHKDGSLLHATAPGTQQRNGEIQLDLRTDKPVYRKGDPIQIKLTITQRSKVEIYNQDSRGRRTPIWPRPGSASSVLSPGQTLHLPPASADWRLIAAEPFGTNSLVARATSVPKQQKPHGSSPEFFQMHTDGWKGIKVEPISKPAPQYSPQQKCSGEVRWLYEVKK